MFAYGGKTPYDKELEAKKLILNADNLRDEIQALPDNNPRKAELRKEREAIVKRLKGIQHK